jgi:hypothetical protein
VCRARASGAERFPLLRAAALAAAARRRLAGWLAGWRAAGGRHACGLTAWHPPARGQRRAAGDRVAAASAVIEAAQLRLMQA